MAHYTQITAALSVLAPSGVLATPGAATVANPVTQIASFDLTIGKDIIEATSLGDDFRQFAQGVGEWGGTLTFHYDGATEAVAQDELLETLLPESFGGTLAASNQVQLNFWIDAEAGASASIAYYGAVFVEDVSLNVGNGLSQMTMRVRGNGSILHSKVLL
tara:strand:- start:1446 stop:1928 length:483 start_codon:yes stop_codon:yes gene_type:complete